MDINAVAVVGAGTMGTGIAQVVAHAGCNVFLYDLDPERAVGAVKRIQDGLAKQVGKGKMAQAQMDQILSLISPVSGLEQGTRRADLVIEAVFENMDTKKQVFKELDAVCQPHTILGSNTTSMSISEMGAATSRPDKVVGIHFFNPAPSMKLVEIVRGVGTSEETLETAQSFVERLGKEAIVATDSPGFIQARVGSPLINEAFYALMEGVGCAEDIDKSMVLGFNHPMGPLALADFIGLDTVLSVQEYLHRELGDPKYRPCPLLRRYVRAGRLGVKTGRGVYEYKK